MKAAVCYEVNKPLVIEEVTMDSPGKGEVKVRIAATAICHSDIHSFKGEHGTPKLPAVGGHEVAGYVDEVGEGVTSVTPGDPVIVSLESSGCGKCYYCREKGLMMKCRHLKKYGHDSCEAPPHFTGGFAEYCYITPGTCVIKVPDNLTDEEVAPANCALATVVAGWEAAAVKPFENVLIQGAGALGFYGAALARHYGCGRIIVSDILDRRLEFIKAFGATDTLNVKGMSDDDTIRAVRDLTGGFGVDCVLEVAGIPNLIPPGLKCLRTGGRYVEIGNSSPGANFTYDACDMVWRRLTLTGIHNYDAKHLQMGVDLLAMNRGVFPFKDLVTHRVNLDDINDGLRIADSGEAVRVAVLP